MNVLMINPNQFGYKAGYYHYCIHLNNLGCKVTYLCRFQDLPLIELPGVEVIYVYDESSVGWRREAKLRLNEIFEIRRIDVILCSYFRGCSVFPKYFKGIPAIMDIRSGDVTPNPVKRGLFNWLIRNEAKKFDHTMILSQSLAEKLKLKRSTYDVVPLGADVISDVPKSYDELNLLYVGTLSQRNVDLTIEGLSYFCDKYGGNKIHYDIVGFGTPEEEMLIREMIKSKGMSDRVIFHGRVNYENLRPYFDRANVGVAFVPQTPYYDCQPSTKIYEYVLSGLYCLATNTYENKLTVKPENGILHEDNAQSFADALETFSLMDKSMISADSVRGSMEEYMWSNVVGQKLLPLLSKVAQKKS